MKYHSNYMLKKSIIFFMLIIGMIFHSNVILACNKPKTSKDKIHLTVIKVKSNQNDNCCKTHNKNSGHDCNKKCNHHNCACSSICFNNYIFEKNIVIETVLYFTTQRQYNIYKPSFYNDVHISIWHPPKIA